MIPTPFEIFVIWASMMPIFFLAPDEIMSSKWKIMGFVGCWVCMGITFAILYPDEFGDAVLG